MFLYNRIKFVIKFVTIHNKIQDSQRAPTKQQTVSCKYICFYVCCKFDTPEIQITMQ